MAGSRFHSLSLILAGLGVLTLVAFGQMPGDIRLSEVLQNAAHAPAFCVLSLIIHRFVRGWGGWVASLVTFGICILLGVAIEGFQALIGSDASVEDVVADGVGAMVGLAGMAYLRTRKTAALLLCSVGVGIAVAPVAWACAAYLNRLSEFPVIAAFHSPLDLYFFKPQTPPLRILPEGLQVRLPKGPWPGVTLEEPAPDWSGYRTLVVEFLNPEDRPLSLVIRIHDRHHNQEMDDRYNRRFELPAHGPFQLSIPLADIQNAPRTRKLDMTQIAGIILFSDPGSAGRSIYLRKIFLEH